MKIKYILIFILLNNICFGQELIRENIGSSGTNNKINNTHIRQSVGQKSSVNGTIINNNITLRQGFQQPTLKFKKINLQQGISELALTIFPNPFRYDFSIKLDEIPQGEIKIIIYDNSARIIKNLKYESQKEIKINCKDLSRGTYIIHISTDEKQFKTYIIKQ